MAKAISQLVGRYWAEIGQHFVGQVAKAIQLLKGMIKASDNKNFFSVELGVKCYHKSIGDWVECAAFVKIVDFFTQDCLKIKVDCK